MQNRLMDVVEKSTLKPSIPKFEIGDTVDVHVRILEGDKERIQIFNGVVIARSGAGRARCSSCAASSRAKASSGKFPVQSPRIADIVVKRSGKVRRAKLYYLRQLSGKAVRLKERFTSTATSAEAKAAKAEAQKSSGRQERESQGRGEHVRLPNGRGSPSGRAPSEARPPLLARFEASLAAAETPQWSRRRVPLAQAITVIDVQMAKAINAAGRPLDFDSVDLVLAQAEMDTRV